MLKRLVPLALLALGACKGDRVQATPPPPPLSIPDPDKPNPADECPRADGRPCF